MVHFLWSFLLNNPDASVPFPWERCFDARTEALFYRNRITGATVIDLRSRVNLGGGLYHVSDVWQEITGRCREHHYSISLDQNIHDQDPPFITAAFCCGPLVFFLFPELAAFCPNCYSQVFYVS